MRFSAKTYKYDAALPRLVPTSLAALQIGAVTDREVSRALIGLVRSGLAESSVKRFRDSLSAFFAWAVRERMIATNPVTPTRVPKASAPRVEMRWCRPCVGSARWLTPTSRRRCRASRRSQVRTFREHPLWPAGPLILIAGSLISRE